MIVGMNGRLLNLFLSILQTFFLVGFKFQITSPLHALQEILNPTETKDNQSNTSESSKSDGDPLVSDASLESELIAISENVTPGTSIFDLYQSILSLLHLPTRGCLCVPFYIFMKNFSTLFLFFPLMVDCTKYYTNEKVFSFPLIFLNMIQHLRKIWNVL